MSSAKTRFKTFFFFLACVLFGVVGGAFFLPLADLLHQSVAAYYPVLQPDIALGLEAAEPQLSRMVIGLAFGLTAYIIFSIALTSYARSLLAALVRRLREKGLLPYTFEAAKKRRGLIETQQGVFELFDNYVEQLQGAHSEKKRFQEALNTYADPNVMERLRGARHGSQTIKSERRPVAVLFADIRGFTAMSEILLPEQVAGLLNDYFTFATAAVNKNGGTVNKFIGDAVMALFEQGPAYKEGSAPKSAILAALQMQEDFQRFLPVWKTRMPQRFEANLGVGVHFGEAILGTLGSAERMEYTAIGDTVNFASRLCSLAKPGQVRVSEDCFERVQDAFEGQAQEAVALKGKAGTHVSYVVTRKRQFG